jgi:hypothetical protein
MIHATARPDRVMRGVFATERSDPRDARPAQLSMKLFSCLERLGWRSFRSAFASI